MMGPQRTWPNSPGMGMGMMRLSVNPTSVPAGQVSLRVANNGWLPHEVIVMPLGPGQSPGQRPIGGNWEVDEAGSLGEAAQTCGAGQGDGIAPGTMGWTTLTLNRTLRTALQHRRALRLRHVHRTRRHTSEVETLKR